MRSEKVTTLAILAIAALTMLVAPVSSCIRGGAHVYAAR